MALDLDTIDDDIFTELAVNNNNARAGGRFQPRGKGGPVKKQPAAIPCSPSQPRLEKESNIAVAKEGSSKPYEEKLAELPNPLKQVTDQERVSHTVESLAQSHVLITGQHTFESLSESKVLVSGQRSGLGKSVEEKTDIACQHYTTEAPAIPVSQSLEDRFAHEVISFSSESTSIMSKKIHEHAWPESSPAQDPLTGCPESLLNEDPLTGHHPILSVSEQVESYSFLESSDISDVTALGTQTRKFQPKPKIHEARSKGSTPSPRVVQSEHLDPFEVQNTTSKFPEDDVFDLLSLGFDHSVPLEPEFQPPVQDMSAEPAPHEGETEVGCDMHEKTGTLVAKANQQSASTSSQLSRPRRKCNNYRQLVDEFEDEEPNQLSGDPVELVIDHNNDKEIQVDNETQERKLRNRSKKPVVDKEKPVRKHKKAGVVTNQDDHQLVDQSEEPNDNNDKEIQVDNKTQEKKLQKRSKKHVVDKENPVRKRKKAGEVTNQDGTISKKFPHSTRPKRRRVDQSLLETPEDEIECQKVPLRDLIILAEYKERMTKSATTSKVPTTGQSRVEGIPPEDVEAAEEPLFNYQTYMVKTPRIRWSNQDTELFYQAMQQFGTDLSLIQQLFPGRTRNQIKLKYKKEERQHPLRLHEALTIRPNDFSHFQHVIEHLQKVAAENQQTDSKDDESIDLVDDEEAEQMSETIDGAAKYEQQMEQGEADNLPAEVPVKSPLMSYESEEDCDFDWSQYNSEV